MLIVYISTNEYLQNHNGAIFKLYLHARNAPLYPQTLHRLSFCVENGKKGAEQRKKMKMKKKNLINFTLTASICCLFDSVRYKL